MDQYAWHSTQIDTSNVKAFKAKPLGFSKCIMIYICIPRSSGCALFGPLILEAKIIAPNSEKCRCISKNASANCWSICWNGLAIDICHTQVFFPRRCHSIKCLSIIHTDHWSQLSTSLKDGVVASSYMAWFAGPKNFWRTTVHPKIDILHVDSPYKDEV